MLDGKTWDEMPAVDSLNAGYSALVQQFFDGLSRVLPPPSSCLKQQPVA
jgi:hypothetical protein